VETYRGETFGQKALPQRMIDDDLLVGEYRLRLRGPLSMDYLGRTTAQEMAIPGGGDGWCSGRPRRR
jgi:hypothetical protein